MEVKSILAIICAAIALVGGIETVYQIYQLTVIDATIRGLKHPKLWGLLASNGNNWFITLFDRKKKLSYKFY